MKPYVTCYMMMSVDGRIDCAMTEQIEGSKEYYEILNKYNFAACCLEKQLLECISIRRLYCVQIMNPLVRRLFIRH